MKNENKGKGQALVELALILPLLLLLIMGALDLARAYYTKTTLTNAAREGAYYLAYNSNDPNGAKQIAINEAYVAGITLTTSDITINNCCTKGNYVEVIVSRSIDLNILQFFSGPMTITAKERMLVLQ